MRTYAVAVLDAVTFSLAVTGATFVAAVLLSIGSGGGAVGVKTFMFVIGWLLMAYAVVRLWPSSPNSDPEASGPSGPSIPETHEIRFQRVTRALPPVRWVTLPPPEHRLRIPAQLFLSSVFVLVASFLLEVGLGVQ
jgi:hypothetical protein